MDDKLFTKYSEQFAVTQTTMNAFQAELNKLTKINQQIESAFEKEKARLTRRNRTISSEKREVEDLQRAEQIEQIRKRHEGTVE